MQSWPYSLANKGDISYRELYTEILHLQVRILIRRLGGSLATHRKARYIFPAKTCLITHAHWSKCKHYDNSKCNVYTAKQVNGKPATNTKKNESFSGWFQTRALQLVARKPFPNRRQLTTNIHIRIQSSFSLPWSRIMLTCHWAVAASRADRLWRRDVFVLLIFRCYNVCGIGIRGKISIT